jgi:hypothetical protein
MEARQIKLGNLLPIVENCLGEHQVNLKDASGKKQSFYLIETRITGNRAADFESTYDEFEDLTQFHLNLADKTWGSRKGPHHPQVYGTLIDTSLQYSFAFNRRFADLSEKKDQLEFLTPDQIFLTDPKPEDYEEALVISPTLEEEDFFDNGNSFSDMLMRYSLQGNKKRKFKGPISFERNSLLGRIKDCIGLSPMAEMPQVGSSKLYSLLKVDYETPTLNDLLMTYPEGFSKFQAGLAEKLLGGKTDKNTYLILVDDQLRMRFAANELFAKHDSKNSEIIFSSPEEALLQFGEDLAEKLPETVPKLRRRPSRRNRPMTFRYSLAGKKEK